MSKMLKKPVVVVVVVEILEWHQHVTPTTYEVWSKLTVSDDIISTSVSLGFQAG